MNARAVAIKAFAVIVLLTCSTVLFLSFCGAVASMGSGDYSMWEIAAFLLLAIVYVVCVLLVVATVLFGLCWSYGVLFGGGRE